jgi:hypothetical protein
VDGWLFDGNRDLMPNVDANTDPSYSGGKSAAIGNGVNPSPSRLGISRVDEEPIKIQDEYIRTFKVGKCAMRNGDRPSCYEP